MDQEKDSNGDRQVVDRYLQTPEGKRDKPNMEMMMKNLVPGMIERGRNIIFLKIKSGTAPEIIPSILALARCTLQDIFPHAKMVIKPVSESVPTPTSDVPVDKKDTVDNVRNPQK